MGTAGDRGDEGVLLQFSAVSFSTPSGIELLHGVDLCVDRGAVTVMAGPSGAGKSTLLRLGNRLEVPSEGVVRFKGADLTALDPQQVRRSVGMIFQRPIPFPGSVRSNLAVADGSAADSAFVAVLQRVGLHSSILNRVADDLSGGEAQRMCIARTLLTEPEVILMDEPTSSLDPENRIGIEDLARELAHEGIGVVWVSHDLSQVQRIADRIEVLIDGRNATPVESLEYLKQGTEGEQ
ncbi:MAG: phosphate ABC transporter ATP-binding protein [Actinomycetota bacterium]